MDEKFSHVSNQSRGNPAEHPERHPDSHLDGQSDNRKERRVEAQTNNWIKLAHAPGIGPATTTALLNHFSHPDAIFTASRSKLKCCALTNAQLDSLLLDCRSAKMTALLRRTLSWLEHPLNHIIHRLHPLYPERLRQISDPPTLLYVTGDPEVLLTPSVGIVGSRKSTPAGLSTAQRLAAGLARWGLTISSGMALGVDQAAHQATLDAGGLTLAVAGTGLDRIYPARHRELAHRISHCGALVSELALGLGPLAHHFPRRNRIISGLSTGVVVVEAALKSGSLITARHARDQGRDVMVVPGSINNPLARGCNALIRQGATLIETAEDIVREIAPQIDIDPRITSGSPPSGKKDLPETSPENCILLKIMGFDPTTVDTLTNQSGQSAHQIVQQLVQLELSGHVSRLSGGRYVRC